MLIGGLGVYFYCADDWKKAGGMALVFLIASLYYSVNALQNIRDTIYDQTAMMVQDMFDEDEEFDHPDYPIEEEDDE